ncbi:hypothetical protein DICPUDRAFT_154738 [Dictyostelium purpureum]|uniref:Histone-lysine N-methyltransferase SETD7 n=1 Tax=Dictyostelium purpureum TaxID=5786 RepID=F0ZS48_DICPU|nr:uncharacterized protein DICPUDRAFT_154738 [Dictyostelium purpureum]EGC33243.1 hypothetical protein DICPUDRAFT_154738 [Dictyostelium purpureum]|eukprot:XP_003290236.1 hypothetical protein DICPUDRAFT_154738 [Dictyostelium purpureum]
MGKQSKKSFLKNNKVKKTNIHNNNSNPRKKKFFSEVNNEINANDNTNNTINNDNDNNDKVIKDIGEEVGKYIGERNENNEKHGKGKLILDGVTLSGQWKNDEIVGEGKYKTKELTLKGSFSSGALNGIVKEFDRETKKLIFEGYYKEGVRSGKGTLYMDDGGSLRGNWGNGSLNGHGIYKFGDQRFTIEGQWENGLIVKGKYRLQFNENDNENDKPLAEYYKELPKKVKEFPIRYDISTDTTISSDPLMMDIYENYYSYVKESSIPNSGEGLFARVDIPVNTTLSFYNGVRIPHKTVNERSWDLNSNTISLNSDVVIDVPSHLSSTSQYCATISHKANHDLNKKNAEYSFYNHPRFGEIKSIKSIKPIKKDEEIFVSYDYTDEKPSWYK